MRELTKEQFSALKVAFEAHLKDDIAVPPYYITFEAGFVAGLDHAAAQGDHQRLEIAKQVEELQAERDEARATVERLKAEQLHLRKWLAGLAKGWRDEMRAKGKSSVGYRLGLGRAAEKLEEIVKQMRLCAIFGR